MLLSRAVVCLALLATACTPVPLAMSSGPQCHARHVNAADPQAWEPDRACTPGVADPAVTLAMLCPHVSPALKRPPTAYTNLLKTSQMQAYGFTGPPAGYEEDHLISRQLGGELAEPKNLWPEPHASFNEKDKVEGAAHAAVCDGRLSLADAQQRIAADWYALGKDLGVIT